MSRVVVVGLEGLDPNLVVLWSNELPNLMRIHSQGIWGKIQSTEPLSMLQSWTSAQTGCSTVAIKADPLFRLLSKRGKKVAIVSVPGFSPPPYVPGGYSVSCSITPDLKNYTSPASLKNEIEQLVGEYTFDVSLPDVDYRKIDKNTVLQYAYKMDNQRFELLKHFINKKQCDYVFAVLMGVNRVAGILDADKTENQNVLKEYYVFIDQKLGELYEVLNDDTALLVHSNYNDGNNGIYGYFSLVGSGVQTGGEKQDVTLLDLAPTVLTIMGEEIPGEIEGKPLVKPQENDLESGFLGY